MDTTEQIRPALDPDEWAEWHERGIIRRIDETAPEMGYHAWQWGAVRERDGSISTGESYLHHELEYIPPECAHALAALLLHSTSYGFTWDDVDALRAEAARGEFAYRTGDNAGYSALDPTLARSLADRIAALLPPREP